MTRSMNLITRILAILLVFAVKSHGETELLAIIMAPSDTVISTNSIWGSRLVTDMEEQDPLTKLFRSMTPQALPPTTPAPPPVDKAALMARYIVHYSLWTSLAHASLQPKISGWPISRVYSVSDGPITISSGVPYLYMTPNDPEFLDLLKDPRASLTMSLAQSSYCRAKLLDPEDPRCAQVTLTGRFVVLKNTTAEWRTAERAVFSRHPAMKHWPKNHDWVFCKLQIVRIMLVDWFGGNKYPSVDDYFKATPNLFSSDNPMLEMAFF
uniref:CREG-like beta-barrel domain-containing protein n=1 Tax=Graphocephala atropunctata TaxID=36148 RepID=A0A1B6MDK3_9HEMI